MSAKHRMESLVLAMMLALFAVGCDEDDCAVCPEPDPSGQTVSARAWFVPAEMPTIAAALDTAAAGDTVLVAGGRYEEYGLDLPPGVMLLGAGDALNPTVLDGGGLGRVLSCEESDTTSFLANLIITGGGVDIFRRRVEIQGCRFVANHAAEYGSAVSSYQGDGLRLVDCDFEENSSGSSGAAVWSYVPTEIIGCTFTRNSGLAVDLNDSSRVALSVFRENEGAGLDIRNGEVVDCQFIENVSLYFGGGLRVSDGARVEGCVFLRNRATSGGGAYVFGEALEVIDCEFIENEAEGSGGGLFAQCTPTIRGVGFRGNRAGRGGALHATEAVLEDCRLINNRADLCSGARISRAQLTRCVLAGNSGRATVLYAGDISRLERCTIANNAVEPGWALFEFSGDSYDTTVFSACVLAFNTGEMVGSINGVVDFENCDQFGNAAGDWTGLLADQAMLAGNFSLDPLFCDTAANDFALCMDSPCLPPSTGLAEAVGAGDVGCVACGE